jgi:DNA-binding CsgD family transcriptional regulator
VQLTPNERDVLYLLVAVGMSQAEIVEKLGASGDWVEVTIAKIKQIYGPVW